MASFSSHSFILHLLLVVLIGISQVSGVADTEYYDILEVEPTISQKNLKKAFQRLSKVKHPDRNSNTAESNEEVSYIHPRDDVSSLLSHPPTRNINASLFTRV